MEVGHLLLLTKGSRDGHKAMANLIVNLMGRQVQQEHMGTSNHKVAMEAMVAMVAMVSNCNQAIMSSRRIHHHLMVALIDIKLVYPFLRARNRKLFRFSSKLMRMGMARLMQMS